ncbi:hypothetical protein BCON_0234g00160 [Botryotinia convoluta]|uniref:Uncharacterized protein n=1 Tax=Botryotinia convoluta TaxID=54673 RepID=A0A4Z1HMZ4_9HELO|nr:hypothetical protein BCON_0234g00160 [Botryotinia convoluta]
MDEFEQAITAGLDTYWDAKVLTKEEQDPSEEKPYAGALGFTESMPNFPPLASRTQLDPGMVSSGEPPAVTTPSVCDFPNKSGQIKGVKRAILLPSFKAWCPNNVFTGAYDDTINYYEHRELLKSKKQSTSMIAPPNCHKPNLGQKLVKRSERLGDTLVDWNKPGQKLVKDGEVKYLRSLCSGPSLGRHQRQQLERLIDIFMK